MFMLTIIHDRGILCFRSQQCGCSASRLCLQLYTVHYILLTILDGILSTIHGTGVVHYVYAHNYTWHRCSTLCLCLHSEGVVHCVHAHVHNTWYKCSKPLYAQNCSLYRYTMYKSFNCAVVPWSYCVHRILIVAFSFPAPPPLTKCGCKMRYNVQTTISCLSPLTAIKKYSLNMQNICSLNESSRLPLLDERGKIGGVWDEGTMGC